MKRVSKNQKGFTLLETLVLIIVIALMCFVGWRVEVSRHNKNLTIPSQANCKSTKEVFFPNNSLNFQMPSCWSTKGTRIVSSNQTLEPNELCMNMTNSTSNSYSCPQTVIAPDVGITIETESTKGYTLQQWVNAPTASDAQPDTQAYALTTLGNQPAECTNLHDSNNLGLKYDSIPPNVPKNIPAGIFAGDCNIDWKNTIYTIGPIDLDSGDLDIQQVYSLLSSLRFN